MVLIGQAAFGKAVLDKLLDRGEQIVAVYAPPDTPERPDALAGQIAMLLDAAEVRAVLSEDEYARLRALTPRLEALCR